MAQGEGSDLIMKFTDEYGNLIPGESTTKLVSSRPELLTGFQENFMFEVDRFSFSAGGSGDPSKTNNQHPNASARNANGLATTAHPGRVQAPHSGKYPIDVHPVSFTRSIDLASKLLMQNCIDCRSYKRASLIKRKSVGGAASGEVYLRFDFVNVLVISVEWSNDDEVEETCQFVCRSVVISYCPQLPNGSLGAIIPGFWSMDPKAPQPPLE